MFSSIEFKSSLIDIFMKNICHCTLFLYFEIDYLSIVVCPCYVAVLCDRRLSEENLLLELELVLLIHFDVMSH